MPKQYPGPPLFGLYRAFLPTGSALLPEALLDSNVLEDLLLLGKTKGPFESAEPVAVAPDGSFVAAWDGPGGIHLRSFNALGLPLGVDTVVMPGATVTGLALERPGLLGQAKDYLLSWGDSAGFHSQAFDSSNKPLGQEVTFPSNPFAPQPATDANGNYVVVLDDGQQLVAQFFTGYGVARSPAIALPISTDYDAGYGGQYRMASDAQGNFVVAYTRFQVNPDKSVTDTLYAQSVRGDGVPQYRRGIATSVAVSTKTQGKKRRRTLTTLRQQRAAEAHRSSDVVEDCPVYKRSQLGRNCGSAQQRML